MARRIRQKSNKSGERRIRSDISRKKCPPGEKWVSGHYRNGSYVRGHCAKNNPIRKETSMRYGWDKGPVWIKEKKIIENSDNNNENSDDRQ